MCIPGLCDVDGVGGPYHLGVCGCWGVFLVLVLAGACEVSGCVCSVRVSGWRGHEACCYLQGVCGCGLQLTVDSSVLARFQDR